ncbi:hypothetical protein WJX73_001513 [Symbiochloris irregularis]|uniref:Uncharacterized protein n=1 Tax=Symbiochloris irregularis TaxID=706552 RepID=A0AAW1NL03_9CHLO
MASGSTADIVPSGEAAKLVEKWLGLSSLSGLYQTAETQSAQPEAHMPGLGLGATLTVKQQARSRTGGVERTMMKRLAGDNKPTTSSGQLAAQQHSIDPPAPGGSLHGPLNDDSDQEDGRALAFSTKQSRSRSPLRLSPSSQKQHFPTKRKKKRFKMDL